MAFSKAKTFDEIPFIQSFWSKALSHPARIIILTHLLENGTTSFMELKKKIPLASTTVSQHLRFLRQSGLIEPKEKFPHTYYTLNKDICKSLANKLNSIQDVFLS